MNKIIISDYIGHCDKNGKPMGHPVKVINETYKLIKPVCSVRVAAPKTHMDSIQVPGCDKIQLKYSVCAFSKEKIKNLIKKWLNLETVTDNQNKDIVWFINVDFSLFMYLRIKKSEHIWINLCYNPLKNVTRWRRKIIESVLEQAEKVILTNKNLEKEIPGKTVYIPDYYYNAELYGKFQKVNKHRAMVCLGTMGREKKVESLILSMKNSEVPLLVCGNFKHDKERYQKLKEISEGKVRVENRFVDDDEYYEMIASSQYVVLPYDMNLYDERTSGILLEAVFLHSVPVAPKELLAYNGIDGIGYQKIEDIPQMLNHQDREREIVSNNDRLIKNVFSAESMRKKLIGQ